MSTGTVKFFNTSKGFGFITPDVGGADIFLPGASVTAAGLANIKPGQRVTFEHAPDTKGPKVVSLTLIGEAPAKPAVVAPPAERVTIYCDPASDAAADVLALVQEEDHQPALHDYVTVPPSLDQLRRLSQQLSEAGQTLVRRYDPLFLALQLDDRFIGEQDFWTAIIEHPTLINGPVLVRSGKARVCKSAEEARAFLSKDDAAAAPKPKTLSPRIAAMLRGEAVAPLEKPAPAKPRVAAPAVKTTAKPKAAAKPISKPKAVAKPRAVTTAKKAAAPKKAVKPAKKTKSKSKK
jgi:cold shock CspA family protein/arsenate reductase-like glutaredoxin family protein